MKAPIGFLFAFLICCSCNQEVSESSKPLVLRSNSESLSVRDGERFRSDYWYLDPATKMDEYVADKINETKSVTFISDIDSLVFDLKPGQEIEFLILLNGTDSCWTRLSSGIKPLDPNRPVLRDTLPFRLSESNNLILSATLNQVDTLDLMFHTAANNISLTAEASKRLSSIQYTDSTSMNSWGGNGRSQYSTGNQISIGQSSWSGLTIWESTLSGPGSDGKFGPNLFDGKIIELNFESNQLIVHSHLPEIPTDFSKIPVHFDGDFMFLDGTLIKEDQAFKNRFLLHSGFSGAVLFDDAFALENQLGSKLEIIDESELKDAQGNVLKTKKAIAPSFKFGPSDFKETPVSFFEGAIGRQKMSVIGGNLIKRFNWYIDLQNAEILVRKNNLANTAF